MGLSAVFVLFLGLHCCTTFAAASPNDKDAPCIITLEQQDKWTKAYAKCDSKEFREADGKFSALPITTKLEDFDFDDKCALHCVVKELGILKPDGSFDKTESIKVWKSNMTPANFAKLETGWNTCIDEAEKLGKGRKETNPCKTITLQTFCFKQKLKELSDANNGNIC